MGRPDGEAEVNVREMTPPAPAGGSHFGRARGTHAPPVPVATPAAPTGGTREEIRAHLNAEDDFMRLCRGKFVVVCLTAAVTFATTLVPRLDAAEEAAADAPKPVTASNPDISVDQLKLLVKPLTREELAVEAGAWRDLLKAKVEEISQLQIGVKQQSQAGGGAESTQPEEDEDAAADAGDARTDRQAELIEKLPQLQDQRTQLIDRLNVVLDAWEAKGGDVEEYRQYVAAVGGLDIDVTDASTTWAAVQGWILSEPGEHRWL